MSELDARMQERLARLSSPQREAELQPGALLNWAGLQPTTQMVDLGAGGGFFSIPAAQAGAHVVAIDPDAGSLAALNMQAQQLGLTIETVVSTAEDWVEVAASATFDLAVLAFVIHEQPLRERRTRLRLLQGIRRIIKPEGILLVVEFRRRAELTMHGLPEPEGWVPGPDDTRRVGPVDLAALAETVGLHVHQVKDLPPICYAALLS